MTKYIKESFYIHGNKTWLIICIIAKNVISIEEFTTRDNSITAF